MDEIFLSVNEGYNLWAEFYDVEENPLIALEERAVDLALSNIMHLEIVDLGCGTGRQTLRLAGHGARMTGVDQSEGMLAKATAKPGASGVKFLHADLDKAFPFADGAFDRRELRPASPKRKRAARFTPRGIRTRSRTL